MEKLKTSFAYTLDEVCDKYSISEVFKKHKREMVTFENANNAQNFGVWRPLFDGDEGS